MFRKLCVFLIVGIVLAYLGFFSYMYFVARETAKIEGTLTQVEFTKLVEQEKQSLFDTGQFFWPPWPSAPVQTEIFVSLPPTPTQTTIPTPVPTQTPAPQLSVITNPDVGFIYKIRGWTLGFNYEVTLWSATDCERSACSLKIIELITDCLYTQWIDMVDDETRTVYRMIVGETFLNVNPDWYFVYRFGWTNPTDFPTYQIIHP